ncbi:hypothetical protein HAX54_010035 [Datura stramonium]|uniref:Uncharacterized protein n=1 Tax=Datura stramonium TaxID=4076 RepID=A0ABS8TH33_DATST|nr:hypothetical protein [Datura stramonium]
MLRPLHRGVSGGGGYRVTVMIHLDDSQVKDKTERDDFSHNLSPGEQTHLSIGFPFIIQNSSLSVLSFTGESSKGGAIFCKFNQKDWVIIRDTAPLIELSRAHTAGLK